MSENTKLWDILGRTDPKATKSFTRGGGFKGTAVKPMWAFHRLTEEFGPCGVGWGVNEPSFQVVPGDNREVLVYCTVSGWYVWETERRTVFGVGGDKVVSYIKANEQYNRPERWESDDEAFKKAFTDALTNAFKFVGVGADVHMGLFDDSKYVSAMREEFSDDPPAKSSAQLKREDAFAPFMRELDECTTLLALDKFKKFWGPKTVADGWTAAWKSAAKDRIEGREAAIRAEMERLSEASDEELAKTPVRETLNASLNVLGAG